MNFDIKFTIEAEQDLNELAEDPSLIKRLKAVRKSLGYLELNPKHPSLNTHKHESLTKKYGKEIFEAYAENNTPQAYRIFWHYGSGKGIITIVAITPHP